MQYHRPPGIAHEILQKKSWKPVGRSVGVCFLISLPHHGSVHIIHIQRICTYFPKNSFKKTFLKFSLQLIAKIERSKVKHLKGMRIENDQKGEGNCH